MTCVIYATYLNPAMVPNTNKHSTYSLSNTRSKRALKSSTSSADNAPPAPLEPEAELAPLGAAPGPRPSPITDRGRDNTPPVYTGAGSALAGRGRTRGNCAGPGYRPARPFSRRGTLVRRLCDLIPDSSLRSKIHDVHDLTYRSRVKPRPAPHGRLQIIRHRHLIVRIPNAIRNSLPPLRQRCTWWVPTRCRLE